MKFSVENDIQEFDIMPQYDYFHKNTGAPIRKVKVRCQYPDGSYYNEYSPDKRYALVNYEHRLIEGTGDRHFMPSLKHFYIDGREVCDSEYKREFGKILAQAR